MSDDIVVLRSRAYPVRISRDWWVYAEDWPTQQMGEDAALAAGLIMERASSEEAERLATWIATRLGLRDSPYGCNLLIVPEVGLNGIDLQRGRERDPRRL